MKYLRTLLVPAIAALTAGSTAGCGDSTEASSGSAKPSNPAPANTRTIKGGDATRGLSVTLPASIKTFEPIVVTMEGATGKAAPGAIGGGFIVRAFFVYGKGGCPAQNVAWEGIGTTTDDLGGTNVFVPGPYRLAAQVYPTTAGAQRLCGYLSRGDTTQKYDLIVDEQLLVAEGNPGGADNDEVTPAGVYTATATDIAGGTPTSAITVTVSGSGDDTLIERVQIKGLKLTTCPSTEDHPLRGTLIDGDLAIPQNGLPNTVVGDSFSAYFKFGGRFAQASVFGGSDGKRELRGVAVLPSKDGACSGSFAFTATLQAPAGSSTPA